MKLCKYCKKCNKETIHRSRLSKTKKVQYYCSTCSSNNDKKSRKKNWWKYLAIKANSRKRDGSITLTEDMIKNLNESQFGLCALTNVKLNIESKWWKPSLDRIDSDKGYYPGNIRLVAWIVNHCRGNLTDKEFINMCNKVASAYHKYPYAEHCILGDLSE